MTPRLMLAWRHWRACRPSCHRTEGDPRRVRWIYQDGFRVCRLCWSVDVDPKYRADDPKVRKPRVRVVDIEPRSWEGGGNASE